LDKWKVPTLSDRQELSHHQSQADVGVAQAVGRPRPAFSVEAHPFLLQNRLEELALPLWEKPGRLVLAFAIAW